MGSPDPKVLASMRHEHIEGPGTESTDPFTTGNYGIQVRAAYRPRGRLAPSHAFSRLLQTSSKIEWFFTNTDEGVEAKDLGLVAWPAEAVQKMPERDLCRRRTSRAALEASVAPKNVQLRAANQPEVLMEEVIAANLYTGPMFVKCRGLLPRTSPPAERSPHSRPPPRSQTHSLLPPSFAFPHPARITDNGVLRGLEAESHFLRNTMVTLCCPKAVADAYLGATPHDAFHQEAAGSLGLEAAVRSLNKYTTTLHGINSAIIKLGKLTKADKVYRGIAGMKLPDEFWTPNEFGVRGGVEQVR